MASNQHRLRRRCAGSAAAALALLLLPPCAGSAARAQSGSDRSPAQSTQPDAEKKPQPNGSADPGGKKPARPHSAAQDNPFPSDVSQRAAQQQGSSASPPPDAPDAPAPNSPQPPATAPAAPAQKPGDAAKENPFPEDVSRGAAAKAAGDSEPALGGSSGSSSTSASGSSSSAAPDGADPNGADPNADVPRGGARHRLRKPSSSDIESGSLAGAGRAADDVRVGSYYYTDGNYQGAYARYSEASRLDPANLDAIYGLAAAADKLHRKDEALANYKLYLDVAPEGKHAKSARKALQQLSQ